MAFIRLLSLLNKKRNRSIIFTFATIYLIFYPIHLYFYNQVLNQTLSSSSHDDEPTILIKCDDEVDLDCSDWSLMLKSIYSGYFISLLLERRFGLSIKLANGCDLNDILKVNQIDWTPKHSKARNVHTVKLVDDLMPLKFVYAQNLTDILSDSLTINFFTNRDLVGKMKRNRALNVPLLPPDIQLAFRDNYEQLFKLSESIQKSYDDLVKLLLGPKNDTQLLCIQVKQHVRDEMKLLRDRTEIFDVESAKIANITNFTLANITSQQPFRVLVLSDSVKVIYQLKSQMKILNSQVISSVDVLDPSDKCADLKRTILDFHVLAIER